MNSFLALIFAILSGYLIGSIPTSYMLGKALRGIDIRQYGSGNVGATNLFRVVGKLPGMVALIWDILKGAFVVTLVANFFYPYIRNLDYGLYRTILALSVICGHIWSAFLRFSGGKGVATTIGTIAVIAPTILFPSLMIWIIVFLFTRYVSLASITLGITFPIFAGLFNQPFYIIAFSVTICILNTYKHKENIKRLLSGEENKTVIFK